jgi:hypothetical protein
MGAVGICTPIKLQFGVFCAHYRSVPPTMLGGTSAPPHTPATAAHYHLVKEFSFFLTLE